MNASHSENEPLRRVAEQASSHVVASKPDLNKSNKSKYVNNYFTKTSVTKKKLIEENQDDEDNSFSRHPKAE